jgi:hypothetical protein
MPICRQNRRTGATGLEPATSGVTGRFEGGDGQRRSPRNRSIDAGLWSSAQESDIHFRIAETETVASGVLESACYEFTFSQ